MSRQERIRGRLRSMTTARVTATTSPTSRAATSMRRRGGPDGPLGGTAGATTCATTDVSDFEYATRSSANAFATLAALPGLPSVTVIVMFPVSGTRTASIAPSRVPSDTRSRGAMFLMVALAVMYATYLGPTIVTMSVDTEEFGGGAMATTASPWYWSGSR